MSEPHFTHFFHLYCVVQPHLIYLRLVVAWKLFDVIICCLETIDFILQHGRSQLATAIWSTPWKMPIYKHSAHSAFMGAKSLLLINTGGVFGL